MNFQNNGDNAQRAITKFVWQLGRHEPSPPSTKELHGLADNASVPRDVAHRSCKRTLGSRGAWVGWKGASIARWICLRLLAGGPGFNPQAQYLCFVNLNCDEKRTRINKKSPRLGHFYHKMIAFCQS